MLKTRILSSIVLVIVITASLLSGKIALNILVFFLAILGVNEVLNAFKKLGHNPVKWTGYLSCILIIAVGYMPGQNTLLLIIFSILSILLVINVFSFKKHNITDISLTLFGIIYTVFLFSFIVLTRNLDKGEYYVWIIFVGAWATDTSAYLIGLMIGKRKILPEISPQKTLEGSIGGILGSILATSVFGLLVMDYAGSIPLYHYIVIGFLSGIAAQIGDWIASSIKRYTNIKDFSSIIPGHGGILDRFDSILMIAPLIYFYTVYFI